MTALLEVSRDSLQLQREAQPSSWQHPRTPMESDWAWEGGKYTRILFELWLQEEGVAMGDAWEVVV